MKTEAKSNIFVRKMTIFNRSYEECVRVSIIVLNFFVLSIPKLTIMKTAIYFDIETQSIVGHE